MSKKYIQCKGENCGYVYASTLDKCPKCGKLRDINEDLNDNTPTFNLLD